MFMPVFTGEESVPGLAHGCLVVTQQGHVFPPQEDLRDSSYFLIHYTKGGEGALQSDPAQWLWS